MTFLIHFLIYVPAIKSMIIYHAYPVFPTIMSNNSHPYAHNYIIDISHYIPHVLHNNVMKFLIHMPAIVPLIFPIHTPLIPNISHNNIMTFLIHMPAIIPLTFAIRIPQTPLYYIPHIPNNHVMTFLNYMPIIT